jgi:hypothetical protein
MTAALHPAPLKNSVHLVPLKDSPGSIHCQASLFSASDDVMRYFVRRRVRRHFDMPYVEVILRAHLANGVIQRMAGRHRSERAVYVSRTIRTVRGEITMGEI